ncbi:VC0807 family protein [Ktedonospora formicarum]|uniref:Intracellular septation protein A n=1 Tax=Ktedonospora formicarum TaxID=2778364 RepID=A0A8J3MVL9_9CHLR|nr:VC0807 family protein [Ktedonospora formicarum]GHO48071.1 hypothetical protein KSX_62340 [Ktedonospora formicarum]
MVDTALPIGLYFALRFMGLNDLVAFAIPAAIPILRVALWWIWKRRIEWIAAFASLGFALGLLGTWLLNGNPVFLKAHGVLLTGPLGLTLLVSSMIGRPLLFSILRLIRPEQWVNAQTHQAVASNPLTRRKVTMLTVGTGLLLTAHALVELILALTLSTDTFLLVSKVAGLSIIILGIALLSWMRGTGSRRQHV